MYVLLFILYFLIILLYKQTNYNNYKYNIYQSVHNYYSIDIYVFYYHGHCVVINIF